LYDYRDRRPALDIDRGIVGDPEWPSLDVHVLRSTAGPDLLLLTGGEPDLAWRGLCADVVELARIAGATRYVGLGSVPGPVPHTRPVRLLTTASDEATLEELGRPHERVIVPGSCQVIVETALRDAGVRTMGLWARIPHYVASTYPEASQRLLSALDDHLGLGLDLGVFGEDIARTQEKLAVAAEGSADVRAHIAALEEAYDQDLADDGTITGPLPTGEQIAAELERFLRQQGDA
jgi:hypothetical protein